MPWQESTVHEVQTLRQELANARKKLQDYADTIVSLHGELRTLRDGICSTCKRKFVPANLVSSQAPEPAVDSSFVNRISPSHGSAENIFSWSSLLKAVSTLVPIGSDPPTTQIHNPTNLNSQLAQPLPILSTPTSISLPPPVLSTNHQDEQPGSTNALAATQCVSRIPCWSARRDATTDPVLDMTFVCAFDHKDSIQSVRFSADGKYLAAALRGGKRYNNGTIIIYDVVTCKKACVLAEYASQYSSIERPGIKCLCFSPAGRHLVFGDATGRVTVWDIKNKRIRNTFRAHSKSQVDLVDFSPNGQLVLSVSLDTVRIWNMRDGSARVFSGKDMSSMCVRFSSSGRFVAVPGHYHFDPNLRIWNVRTGHLVERVIRHEGDAQGLTFTLDGKGLVRGKVFQGPVKYWDDSLLEVRSDASVRLAVWSERCQPYIGHTGTISSIVISPNGQWIVSTSSDKTAILWDTRTAMRQYTLIGHEDAVSSADFSPAGTYFATGSNDGSVTLWRYIGT